MQFYFKSTADQKAESSDEISNRVRRFELDAIGFKRVCNASFKTAHSGANQCINPYTTVVRWQININK